MARPTSRAHWSSASALVPFMSDLKPPSQNNPGAAPSRMRTAIRRAAGPVPTSMDRRTLSFIPDVFRRKPPSDQGDRAAKTRKATSSSDGYAKVALNPAILAATGVDICPDNPDSVGFRNNREFAPIRRPQRSQAPVQKDGQRINEDIRVREV